MRYRAFGLLVVVAIFVAIACKGPSGPGADPVGGADAQVAAQAVGASVAFRAQLFHLESLLQPGSTSVAFTTPTVVPSPSPGTSPMPSPTPTGSGAPSPTPPTSPTATPFPSPSPFPSNTATPAPTPGGNTADTDGDGVPEDATYGYSDTPAETPYGDGEADGTVSATDDNADAADGNYSGAFSLEIDIVSNPPWDWTDALIGLDGSFSVVALTSAYEMISTVTTEYEIERPTGRHTVLERSVFDIVWTPTAAWTPGDPLSAGTFVMDGAIELDVDGKFANAALTTEVPLTIDPGCRQRIVGGRLAIAYSGGGRNHLIRIVWSACDDAIIAYTSELVQE